MTTWTASHERSPRLRTIWRAKGRTRLIRIGPAVHYSSALPELHRPALPQTLRQSNSQFIVRSFKRKRGFGDTASAIEEIESVLDERTTAATNAYNIHACDPAQLDQSQRRIFLETQ
jgi:hypothetical protein